MKSSLRPTSPEDLPALRRLLAQAFGISPGVPFLDPAVMTWKYWGRRDDWTAPRSYVLEKEGAITAHAGLWPVTFGEGPDALRGIQMIDWASARESAGAGLALVQKLAFMFDFIYSVGGSEMTRKALPAFGFVEYTRQWHGVRPLRPVRQMLTHQTRNWKLLPRLVRNTLWALSKNVSPYKNWRAVAMEPREMSPAFDAAAAPRPPAFFEYLLRCPGARFSFYNIVDGREVQGHFALNVVRGQAKVAGVWLREPARDAWTAAYLLTQQAARHLPGANEIVISGSEGLSRESAAQAGFQLQPGPAVYLLDKKHKLTLPPNFQFQLSDDDTISLDTGAPSYWT